MGRLVAAGAAVAALAAAVTTAGQEAGAGQVAGSPALGYQVVDLGQLEPGIQWAFGVNERGQVVGRSGDKGFLWQNGVMTALAMVPGASGSTGLDINDAGQVVGNVWWSPGGSAPATWDRNGTLTLLPKADPQDESSAIAIDERGLIGGSSGTNPIYGPVLWEGGAVRRLASGALRAGFVNAVNERGEAAGYASFEAAAWDAQGTLRRLLPEGTQSIAWGMNDLGQAVGQRYELQNGQWRGHAFFHDGMRAYDLDADPTTDSSVARDVNNAGTVIGTSSRLGAFLWTQAGGMVPLDALLPAGSGWKLFDVQDINERGEIVGSGSDGKHTAAVLLRPDLRVAKGNVQAEIAAATAGAGKKDADRLGKASAAVSASLEARLWLDGTHLDARQGDKVFQREQDAVRSLDDLLRDARSGIGPATVQAWIDRLVAVDRALALLAIEQATEAGGDARKLGQAAKELAQAADDAAKGKPDGAIGHYGDAWDKATASTR